MKFIQDYHTIRILSSLDRHICTGRQLKVEKGQPESHN